MARLASPRTKTRPRLEIIPFIDIMFFLLATFMMVSLTLIRNEGITVKLPKASSSGPIVRKEQVYLSITKDNGIYWDKEPIEQSDLAERLKELKASQPEARVFINGDEGANYGKAIAVLDAVRMAGITSVSIETEKADEVLSPSN